MAFNSTIDIIEQCERKKANADNMVKSRSNSPNSINNSNESQHQYNNTFEEFSEGKRTFVTERFCEEIKLFDEALENFFKSIDGHYITSSISNDSYKQLKDIFNNFLIRSSHYGECHLNCVNSPFGNVI